MHPVNMFSSNIARTNPIRVALAPKKAENITNGEELSAYIRKVHADAERVELENKNLLEMYSKLTARNLKKNRQAIQTAIDIYQEEGKPVPNRLIELLSLLK